LSCFLLLAILLVQDADLLVPVQHIPVSRYECTNRVGPTVILAFTSSFPGEAVQVPSRLGLRVQENDLILHGTYSPT
jgi:hypothetical protein